MQRRLYCVGTVQMSPYACSDAAMDEKIVNDTKINHGWLDASIKI
jgi:hypothetical protein